MKITKTQASTFYSGKQEVTSIVKLPDGRWLRKVRWDEMWHIIFRKDNGSLSYNRVIL